MLTTEAVPERLPVFFCGRQGCYKEARLERTYPINSMTWAAEWCCPRHGREVGEVRPTYYALIPTEGASDASDQ